MPALYVAWQLAAFLLGASLGSFVALGVLRIPRDQSITSPPSACPVCETRLAWWENLPVLSWLLLRARCRTCDAPISPMYPLVELTGGGLGWLLFHRFVPAPALVDAPHLAAFGVYLVFATLLLLAALTDVRARIIPEIASIYAVPVGVLGVAALEALGYHGWLDIGWRQAVAGAAVGGLFLGGLSWLWHAATGSIGLAWGDVRLMAMIGAFLGAIPGTWTVLLLASFLGAGLGLLSTVVWRRSAYLPFAPSLAMASMIYVLWGDVLVPWLMPGLTRFL